MTEIWLAQERDESMCKPSNLKEETLLTVPVDVLSSGRFVRARRQSIIFLVVVVFISMSFSLAQMRSFVRKVDISVLVLW